jgi:trigger factor
VKVSVPRADIEHFENDAVKELMGTAAVPGFRMGHVPRKLVERRFKKEVSDHVKQKVLVNSLEQAVESEKIDAINEPTLDVADLAIPEEGDFTYEFDVEVRPEFELPKYEGLSLKRPVKEVADADVTTYIERYLSQFGQLVPLDGAAEAGDYVTVSIHCRRNGEALGHAHDETIRIRPVLRFRDAELADFDKLMVGAKPGDKKSAEVTVSAEAEKVELRGEKVQVEFDVSDVKRLRLPEMNKEFLEQIGVESEEKLKTEVREVLERQVVYEQRQSTRRQVLDKMTESATWELPESLVRRQVDNALRREILEMQQAGFTDEQIRARENELLQQQISMTRRSLKEHFILDKLATQEKLEVSPVEIETEIAIMASQRGESPRKMRARMEKQGLIENLMAQMLERKAVDVILGKAVYEDVPAEKTGKDQIEAIYVSVCDHGHEHDHDEPVTPSTQS